MCALPVWLHSYVFVEVHYKVCNYVCTNLVGLNRDCLGLINVVLQNALCCCILAPALISVTGI